MHVVCCLAAANRIEKEGVAGKTRRFPENYDETKDSLLVIGTNIAIPVIYYIVSFRFGLCVGQYFPPEPGGFVFREFRCAFLPLPYYSRP